MKRILIVDDHIQNRYLLRAMLQALGHQTDEASNGEEALEIARRTPPDLIISDLLMPGMDGYMLLQHWRADEHLGKIPFIVYTATYADPRDAQLARDLGADAFILKPAEPDVFLAEIEKLISLRETHWRPAFPAPPTPSVLREYNEVLVRKLEEKNLELRNKADTLAASEGLLRQSVRELEDMTRAMDEHAIIAITDADGKITFVNDKFCALSGYVRTELARQNHRLVKSGHHPPEFFRHLWETVSCGGVWHGDIKNRAKDGEAYWVASTIVPFLGKDGKPHRYIAISTDITARKLAEERNALQRDTLISLTGDRDLGNADLATALQRIVEAAARTLRVGRVGFWRYTANRESLQCLNLYETAEKRHSSGLTLSSEKYPVYFQALAVAEVIAADDALQHPQTREFADGYLRPLGISSMLDVPVHVDGRLEGVLCHEHLGQPRQWVEDEKTFAVAMASLVSLAIESAERRRTEDALHLSEERFREAVETIDDVLWVNDAGQSRILYVSPAYEKVWGRPIRDIYDNPRDWFEAIHPDDRERLAQALPQQRLGPYEQEYRIIRQPDGETRWIRDRAFPVRSASGEVERIVGVARDITERKLAEQEVERREEHFRLLIEQATDMIGVISNNGVIRYQSPSTQHFLGYTAEELLGRNAFEMVHPEDVPTALAALERAVSQPGTSVTVEYRARHQAGHWRTLQSVGRSIPGRADEGFIVLNSRDVTEQRQLEEQLRQSQKMEAIGQLAGGVAHDFNNLLTVIQGNASLMMLDARQDARAREHSQQILQVAERAANLTRQLLMFSRKQVMQTTRLDLNETVTGVLRMLQRIVGETITLEAACEPRLPLVLADAGMIEQVLLNLVVNARDAMPGGGILRIATRREQAEVEGRTQEVVRLSVSDSGCGIPPDVLPHIFEPFFTTKEVGKGTGLGLATVYGIVKQHQGWVRVESVVKEGATFHVYLPAIEGTLAASPQQISPDGLPAGTETIMVAEDEPLLRSLVINLLQRCGYTVLAAESGVAALRLWEEHRQPVHLLLTDMVMPDGMTGQDLARRLQALQPDLKVIFTSGYSPELTGQNTDMVEGLNFLQKPYRPMKLAQTVRSRLDAL